MSSSIWEKDVFYKEKDIIIVGSGFAGLWAAYHLSQKIKKARILILEKNIAPAGASTRNAGFSCFGSPTELLADEQALGTGAMLSLVEMRWKGLQSITKTFSHKEIDYQATGGYELFGEGENRLTEDLKEQVQYLNQLLKPIIGTKPFELLKGGVNRFGFKGISHVIKNKTEGQLHPGKLWNALVTYLSRKNIHIINGVEVHGFEEAAGKVHVHTNLPHPFITQTLLICNNGIAGSLLPGFTTTPARGQVLVTSPIPGLAWQGSFHFDEGYYYFRNVGNRVLLGGARNKAFEEEETYSHDTSPIIQNELEHFLKTVIIPESDFTIEHRWSGTMGMGKSKLPDLAKITDHVFCAVNFGGIGVALAPFMGQQVAEMVHENGLKV